MANKRAKQQRSKAKDARQMPVADCCPPKSKSKKDKPFIVEWRLKDDNFAWSMFGNWKEWKKYGKYRTEKDALMVIEQQSRKDPHFEYRLVN